MSYNSLTIRINAIIGRFERKEITLEQMRYFLHRATAEYAKANIRAA